MSLFLTSDENVYGNDNTRTAFDNCIDQDFFARDGKNIALKEIFLMRGHQMFDWDQQQKNSWSKSFLP